MFHSKEVKQQLEQASQMKIQTQEYVRILQKVQQDAKDAQVEIDQLGMSASKMDRSLTKVVDYARDTKGLQEQTKEGLEQLLVQARICMQQEAERKDAYLDKKHFLEQQQEQLEQQQEKCKHYTSLSKTVAEDGEKEQQCILKMQTQLKEMTSFVGMISNLALQSAIEAGRMGEEGAAYIKTAEEIRALASGYGFHMEEMTRQLEELLQQQSQSEEHRHSVICAMKDHTVSLQKMTTETVQHNQKNQTIWEEEVSWEQILEENLEHIEHSIQRQEQVLDEMEVIGTCYMEQQQSTEQMDEIIGAVKQMLSQIELRNEMRERGDK